MENKGKNYLVIMGEDGDCFRIPSNKYGICKLLNIKNNDTISNMKFKDALELLKHSEYQLVMEITVYS